MAFFIYFQSRNRPARLVSRLPVAILPLLALHSAFQPAA